MHIRRILFLRGPNIWANSQIAEGWVDLGELKDSPTDQLPGFNERLQQWMPSLIEHRCSVGEVGGFFERLRRGTYLAHVLEHVVIELQSLAGSEIGYGKARETTQDGLYRVVVKYHVEDVLTAAMHTACDLILAAVHDRPFDTPAAIDALHELVDRLSLGPSTMAIVNAAKARDIPTRRLNRRSLVLLGQGRRSRRIWTAETDQTSAIAETIAQDKQLTKSMLRSAGVPVPEGRVVTSAADAWQAASELSGPVVIKPIDGNHGRAVSIGLTEQQAIEEAYEHALSEGSGVIVEQFAPGVEHRLLVVGNRLVAATRGEDVVVRGDGRHSIAELIEVQLNSDPRRGSDETHPLCRVKLNLSNTLLIRAQGFEPESVPPVDMTVLIQRSDNLAIDVTDEVHPLVAQQAVLAARIVGLDIAGLDVVAEDVSRTLEEQGGAVVEVNAGPGLLMHLKPSQGTPRPVGEAIVEMLFPNHAPGRIPIVAVSGSAASALTLDLVEHLWRANGQVLGTGRRDGIRVGDRQIRSSDGSRGPAQHDILLHPDVEAALFEISLDGALSDGLGFDRCQVAVVTDVDLAEDLTPWYFDDVDRLIQAKRVAVDVVLPTGHAVLNAVQPEVASMAEKCKGQTIYFSEDELLPVVAEHRRVGGRAVLLRGADIWLVEGQRESRLASTRDLSWFDATPTTRTAVLAASATAVALGQSPERLQAGLLSWHGPVATRDASSAATGVLDAPLTNWARAQ